MYQSPTFSTVAANILRLTADMNTELDSVDIDCDSSEILTHKALLIPEIRLCILKHMDMKTVLTCRALNSDWQANCLDRLKNRAVVRLRGARFDRFIKIAKRSRDFLANGDTIHYDLHIETEIIPNFFSVCNPIVKYLTFNMSRSSLRSLVSVLNYSSNSLETLILVLHRRINMENFAIKERQRYPFKCTLPRLKSLRVFNVFESEFDGLTDLFIDLVNCSPNLEAVHNLPLNNRFANGLMVSLPLDEMTISLPDADYITQENLRKVLLRVASNLTKLIFRPEKLYDVFVLEMDTFAKVTHLVVNSARVYTHLDRITAHSFPSLVSISCTYLAGNTNPFLGHNSSNQVLNHIPHRGVRELDFRIYGNEEHYEDVHGNYFQIMPLKFPSTEKYSIQGSNFKCILPTLFASRNPQVTELSLDLSSFEKSIQEYFTGIPDDKLPLLKRRQDNPANDSLRVTPSIGDLPNLQTLEVLSSIFYPSFSTATVSHGIARLKNLKRLTLPYIPFLSLRFIANNFNSLEYLNLIGCLGGKKFPRDLEYLQSTHPKLQLIVNYMYKCDSHRCTRCKKAVKVRKTHKIEVPYSYINEKRWQHMQEEGYTSDLTWLFDV